ncbi:GNAT family N-acetyltransferase [Leptothermofonsia sp. ETS-13]|uniref:GNAT family N-acetyltransferase n=1 Tax=Leptothermofonsia sp. ETS-13 TaxID=3035696 RepID=UPI003B9E1F84
MGFLIRQMQFSDLEIAVSWAAQEGWNPGLYDVASFYVTDPKGFLMGELDGEPVSCISAIAYDEAFGFIGFYIVRPEFRGRGYGWQTWQRGMQYLGDRNIGLDGVLAQQENYRKSGFSLAYRNIRYQGSFPQLQERATRLLSASDVSFQELLEFDSQFFPVPRPSFLKAWIAQPASISLLKQEDHHLVGFGVIRPCWVGWKIGPLFALDETTADELFRALVAYTNGATCFLDIPEPNSAALNLVNTHLMTPVFETARMYTKEPPDRLLKGIFGVTTFELG